MSYKPDPANDPNDAYAVIPTPAELGGPTDWWTVTTAFPCGTFHPTRAISREVTQLDPSQLVGP